jgi:hypothetical protein
MWVTMQDTTAISMVMQETRTVVTEPVQEVLLMADIIMGLLTKNVTAEQDRRSITLYK